MPEHLHVVVASGHEGALTEAAEKLKRMPCCRPVSIGPYAPTKTPSQTWLVVCAHTAKDLRDHLCEVEGIRLLVAELDGSWATHGVDVALVTPKREVDPRLGRTAAEALPADDETPPLPWWTLARWLRR